MKNEIMVISDVKKKYSTQIKLKSEYDFHPTKYLIDYLDKTFRKIANDLETSKTNIKKYGGVYYGKKRN